MAITVIGHISKVATSSGATTSTLDTTGADTLVFFTSGVPGAFTVSDSKVNTWTALTQWGLAGDEGAQLYYAKNATVGAGHTFTTSGANSFSPVAVLALAGGDLTAPFDVENGTHVLSTTIQPGSITPGSNNEIVICGYGGDDTGTAVHSIDSGFTKVEDIAFVGGNSFSIALGYIIQTTAGAVNPTWSGPGSNFTIASGIASFKAATGGGGRTLFSPAALDGLSTSGPKQFNPSLG